MPKKTFINLREDKRDKFLAAAYGEFSTKGFYGASLTQLVKDLGIAKGSLYQYFENKEDIYGFLLEEACKRRLSFLEVLAGKPREDYFFNYLLISLKFDATYPQMASLIYGGLSSLDYKAIRLIEQEFCKQVPQQYLAKGIPLLLLAEANFIDLITKRDLFLEQLANNNVEITVSSEEIVNIVQSNIVRI